MEQNEIVELQGLLKVFKKTNMDLALKWQGSQAVLFAKAQDHQEDLLKQTIKLLAEKENS